jgi:hypothetical protein
MSNTEDNFLFEEIELTEGFSKHIYDWYVENKIINHPLSRADYVRAHNQQIQSIFDDLKELLYCLEKRDSNAILNSWGLMDEEIRELVPFSVIDYIDKIRSEYQYEKQKDDDF